MRSDASQPILQSKFAFLLQGAVRMGFKRTDFVLDRHVISPTFPGARSTWHFTVITLTSRPGEFFLEFAPGNSTSEEKAQSRSWTEDEYSGGHTYRSIAVRFATWLTLLRREIEASGRSTETAPKWLDEALPAEALRLRTEARSLYEQFNRYQRMSGLFWQSGSELESLVRDVFVDAGIEAVLSEQPEYDVLVTLSKKRKLYIEVTGQDGPITKASNKVSQATDVQLRVIPEGSSDRVLIALNAYKKEPPRERAGKPLLTEHAERILIANETIVVSTEALFNVWLITLDDPLEAKKALEALYDAPGGTLLRLL